MNFLQLKYFMRVAELGSVGKAAHEYHIAPSAVSHHIKSLEQELDTELLSRGGSRMLLNANGEIFYRHARNILGLASDAQKEIADRNGNLNYDLNIATLTIPKTVPIIVKQFRERYPAVRLQISQYQKYHEQLSYDSDVVIYSTEIPLQKENSRILYEEPILLAVSKDHPFARRGEVEASELGGEKFIRRSTHTDFRQNMEERFFEAVGIAPSTALVTDYPPLINKLVALNFGIAFLGKLTYLYSQDELVLVKIKDVDLRRYNNISWRDNGYQSVATRLFVDFTVKFFENLDEEGKR